MERESGSRPNHGVAGTHSSRSVVRRAAARVQRHRVCVLVDTVRERATVVDWCSMNLLSALLSLISPARLRVRDRPAARRCLAPVVAVIVLATACGSAGIDVADVAAEPATERPTIPAVEPTAIPPVDPGTTETESDPESTTDLPPADGRVDSVQGVAAATVKVIVQGVSVAPLELEQDRFQGIGTGFIIDQSGLMVTNNHVIGGAALIEVYLDGATSPTPARLLGVSECSDLAVLDLEGDGYPYLEFRTSMDDVVPGLPVFAAGYPGLFDNDPLDVDYTLTGGIVNTTTASGDSRTSAVEVALEHDARIRGGNSGGPLVDEQGRVVGINYEGNDADDLNIAIDALAAWPIIEELQSGNVESLGINGLAIANEQISGIWVSGVASGTPADRAGLVAGDLITQIEGIPAAGVGTLETYCDIIRTRGTDATISIEVVRLGSEEVLTGQFNGTPLSQSFSFADELADEMTDTEDGPTTTGGYTEYEFVADDTDSVGVEVPVEWIERNGATNPEFGESLYASPDLEQFLDGFDVPGVIVERSTEFTAADIDAVLDLWGNAEACTDRGGREDFETADGLFTGKWEVFTGCGNSGAALLTIAVSPADGNSVIRMLFQIVTDADLEAADRAIASFDSVS